MFRRKQSRCSELRTQALSSHCPAQPLIHCCRAPSDANSSACSRTYARRAATARSITARTSGIIVPKSRSEPTSRLSAASLSPSGCGTRAASISATTMATKPQGSMPPGGGGSGAQTAAHSRWQAVWKVLPFVWSITCTNWMPLAVFAAASAGQKASGASAHGLTAAAACSPARYGARSSSDCFFAVNSPRLAFEKLPYASGNAAKSASAKHSASGLKRQPSEKRRQRAAVVLTGGCREQVAEQRLRVRRVGRALVVGRRQVG